MNNIFRIFATLDGLVKSLLLRHSRVGGNDEKLAKCSFYDIITLRDWQFYRICFVTEALEYINTPAAPMPRISGKLANCKL